ncbi:hypothetical protein HUG17_6496 [Dermatophagoides farinae]|uniref:Uncharacterized protein n=1 Tax=Dermatophagoides farinae TaxID=6954 RepID=A0A9D4P5U6_DERFA|nr:hypothetical protein HUG17_6496 [Dermatophagoides farinae]
MRLLFISLFAFVLATTTTTTVYGFGDIFRSISSCPPEPQQCYNVKPQDEFKNMICFANIVSEVEFVNQDGCLTLKSFDVKHGSDNMKTIQTPQIAARFECPDSINFNEKYSVRASNSDVSTNPLSSIAANIQSTVQNVGEQVQQLVSGQQTTQPETSQSLPVQQLSPDQQLNSQDQTQPQKFDATIQPPAVQPSGTTNLTRDAAIALLQQLIANGNQATITRNAPNYLPSPVAALADYPHSQKDISYAHNNIYTKPPGLLTTGYFDAKYKLYSQVPDVYPDQGYNRVNSKGPKYNPPKLLKINYEITKNANHSPQRVYAPPPRPAYPAPASPPPAYPQVSSYRRSIDHSNEASIDSRNYNVPAVVYIPPGPTATYSPPSSNPVYASASPPTPPSYSPPSRPTYVMRPYSPPAATYSQPPPPPPPAATYSQPPPPPPPAATYVQPPPPPPPPAATYSQPPPPPPPAATYAQPPPPPPPAATYVQPPPPPPAATYVQPPPPPPATYAQPPPPPPAATYVQPPPPPPPATYVQPPPPPPPAATYAQPPPPPPATYVQPPPPPPPATYVQPPPPPPPYAPQPTYSPPPPPPPSYTKLPAYTPTITSFVPAAPAPKLVYSKKIESYNLTAPILPTYGPMAPVAIGYSAPSSYKRSLIRKFPLFRGSNLFEDYYASSYNVSDVCSNKPTSCPTCFDNIDDEFEGICDYSHVFETKFDELENSFKFNVTKELKSNDDQQLNKNYEFVLNEKCLETCPQMETASGLLMFVKQTPKDDCFLFDDNVVIVPSTYMNRFDAKTLLKKHKCH